MSTGITPLTPKQEVTNEQQALGEGYVHRELIAIDMFANATTGGNNDETISSRLARWSVGKKGLKGLIGRLGSKGLDLFQKDHGAEAMAGDLARATKVANIEVSDGTLPEEVPCKK